MTVLSLPYAYRSAAAEMAPNNRPMSRPTTNRPPAVRRLELAALAMPALVTSVAATTPGSAAAAAPSAPDRLSPLPFKDMCSVYIEVPSQSRPR